MMNYLTIGIVLGLSGGLSPGPLMTLVISETFQHGTSSGMKVAIAPIICDLPLIVLTCFVLAKLSDFHNILGIISLVGGAVIFFMGYKDLRSRGGGPSSLPTKPSQSLMKGILANFLNPNPYLFWFSVGAPTLTKAIALNIGSACLFISGFYGALVGSKAALALLIGRSRTGVFLKSSAYLYVLRFLGLLLCILSLLLFRDGLKLLRVI